MNYRERTLDRLNSIKSDSCIELIGSFDYEAIDKLLDVIDKFRLLSIHGQDENALLELYVNDAISSSIDFLKKYHVEEERYDDYTEIIEWMYRYDFKNYEHARYYAKEDNECSAIRTNTKYMNSEIWNSLFEKIKGAVWGNL